MSLSLADPPASSALVGATLWLQQLATGTLATSIAVIAIAAIGMMMLGGRIELRRGVTVLIGCFLIFGASSIAAGILGAAQRAGPGQAPVAAAVITQPAPAPVIPTAPPGRDPYAGAALQPR